MKCDQINDNSILDEKNFILIKVDSFQNTVAHRVFINRLDTTRHLIITYLSDGTVIGKSYFRKGLRDGPNKVFYSSGKSMADGDYANGMKNGAQLEFYPNGKLRKKEVYIYGKLISTETFDSSEKRDK